MVALSILPLLMELVGSLSGWLGIAAQSYTLKLALFHTLFNLLGLLLMVPLVPLMLDRFLDGGTNKSRTTSL